MDDDLSPNVHSAIGTEVMFQFKYGALLRAMTSAFIAEVVKGTRRDMSVPARYATPSAFQLAT
jgi:hypothetical protein